MIHLYILKTIRAYKLKLVYLYILKTIQTYLLKVIRDLKVK